MNPTAARLARIALATGIIAGLTGCIVIKISVNSDQHPHRHSLSQKDCCTEPPEPPVEYPAEELKRFPDPGTFTESGTPDTSSGSVNVPIGSLLNNPASTGCFRSQDGWNKYFPMPKYYLGPSASHPNSYPNPDNVPFVSVRTCNSTNGTQVKTGVVIVRDDAPNTDKKCVTNSPSCLNFTNLTINQKPTLNNKLYRATIFVKGSSLGTLTNIIVDWSYP